ncbi:MAG: repeat-containing protein [Candidatus Saganbacteria bacterium]|uniref:Repeat-containing protein n=1 Tax=Candidatus Saganbacteria bacterium TaxID=2575572 RepID=A0A833L1D1_UNCSA|nr:MAG: repeat-containing protein [Candidatus Saganbacteria bacterium]
MIFKFTKKLLFSFFIVLTVLISSPAFALHYLGGSYDGYSSSNSPSLSVSNFTAEAASSAQINYTWTDNSTNETGFQIIDGSGNIKVSVAADAVSASETELSANTQYTRKVQAYNGDGAATSDAVSKYTSIEAASSATWEGVTETSITIHSGNALSNLTSGSSGVYFENVTAGTNSGWIQDNSWTSSGLTANTAYTFRITARNGEGIMTTTLEASKSTAEIPIPVAPTNFNAAAASTSSFSCTWTDNSTNESGFQIIDGSGNIKVTAEAGATSTSEAGLSANTQYTRKVQAYNGSGAATSEAVSKYTLIEAASSATWEGVTETSITIHSGNALSNLASGSSGVYFENVTAGTNSGWIQDNSWTSSGLTANTAYTFRITGRNGDGVITTTLEASKTAATIPTPAAPTNFNAVAASTSSFSCTWTDNSTNESGFRVIDGSGNIKVSAAANAVSASETGLSANTQYARSVQAYNDSGAATSDAVSKYTLIEAASSATWEGVTETSITIHSGNALSNLTSGSSGIYFENVTAGTNSGWIQDNSWTSSGLTANTAYTFRITGRNGDGVITTTLEASKTAATVAAPNVPSAEAFSNITSTVIRANWGANSNPSNTQYYCENTTAVTNSGWTTTLSWESTSLIPEKEYTFKVKAKDTSSNESSYTSLGTAATSKAESIADSGFVINGTKVINSDIISVKPKLAIKVVSTKALDVSTIKIYVDDVLVTDGSANEGTYDSFSGTTTDLTIFYTPKTDLETGSHKISVEVLDIDGTMFRIEKSNLKVMEAIPQIEGKPLSYPNPFNPLKGDMTISYVLQKESDVIIFIFDSNGKLVFKKEFLSGNQGGNAGYNDPKWDGKDLFGKMLDNDIYFIKILNKSDKRELGKIKIMILKGN